jgi:hypothetical protein
MKNNKQFDKLILAFFKLDPFLPGAITKQYKICGKPNCRCMDKKNPRKHPSFQLSYTLENKRSTVYIKKSDVEMARKMTESYKKLREIITEMALESIKVTREHGAEAAFKIMLSAFDKNRCKALSGKSETGKLRDAKISRNSWKNRALKGSMDILGGEGLFSYHG